MKLDLERIIPIVGRFRPIFLRLLPIFIKVFPFFERIVPIFVSYVLERSFKALKREGSIEDYRTRTVRVRKCYYRIDIRLVITEDQSKTALNNVLTKIIRILQKDKINLGERMPTKNAEIERVDSEIEEISQRILSELQSASSKDLSDIRYAKKTATFIGHSLHKKGTATNRKCYIWS
jgi:hypothetical protein